MPATNFNAPVYASTNPAIADLFRSEFAQRQAQQAAYEALAAQDTRRQEIAAQERLAQSQQKSGNEQQNYNNLFRMAELKDRQQGRDETRAIQEKQLEIDKTYKEGVIANAKQKPGQRTDSEWDSFETDSETASNTLSSAYQSRLAIKQAEAKKRFDDAMEKIGIFGIGTWGEEKAKKDYEAAMAILPEQTFNEVLNMATQYYQPGLFRVDPITKSFIPIKRPGAKAMSSASSQVEVEPPVPFNMNGSKGTSESADEGTGEGSTPYTMISPNGAMQTFPTRDAMNAAVPSAIAASTPALAAVPSAQMVSVPVRGGTLEMPSNVADEVERQLHAGAAANVIMDALLKSGRARLLPPARTMTPTQTLPPIPPGY